MLHEARWTLIVSAQTMKTFTKFFTDRLDSMCVCGIPGCKGHEVKKDADGEFIELSTAQLGFSERDVDMESTNPRSDEGRG
jgi:hypothetical protein